MKKLKLFKSADELFADIGFTKVYESNLYVQYERYNEEFKYMQSLDLGYKRNGYHLIMSSVKDVNSEGFNNMVGLTMYEVKLCLKKMRELKWRMKK